MKMTQVNINFLRDTLYYTHEKSGSGVERGRGVVLGVVGALMAGRNIDFAAACKIVQENLPAGYRKECIPGPWEKFI